VAVVSPAAVGVEAAEAVVEAAASDKQARFEVFTCERRGRTAPNRRGGHRRLGRRAMMAFQWLSSMGLFSGRSLAVFSNY
jgi:hypothetical protein